jgi:hypothetical protein
VLLGFPLEALPGGASRLENRVRCATSPEEAVALVRLLVDARPLATGGHCVI